MKIVFLKARASLRGGLEKYTSHLTQAFAKKGCQVILLTTGTVPALEGVEAISLAPDTSFTLRHLKRFDHLCQKWLQEHPSTIVFGMERTTFQTHYRAGNGVHGVYLERRKLVDPFWKRLTFAVNPLHRSLLAMEKRAFESSQLQRLFTNSRMVYDEILERYPIPHEKLQVVHNGVEWKSWENHFEKGFERKATDPLQLLFVGNGYQRKGLKFLLQGLALLRKENFLLTVIGKDKNIPRFKQMAERLELQDKVRFLGPQTHLIPFYQEADILVIPSIYDPFANVTLEALAMGLFVVSSAYNGGKEVLTPETGLVIDELISAESVKKALEAAFQKKKTKTSASLIRESVKGLDFSNQLDKIVTLTISR